jgi:surface-anchored protein
MNPRILQLTFLLVSAAHGGLTPLGEHVDVRCHFESGAWGCVLRTDGQIFDPQTAFLPLADKPYVNGNPAISGARHTQPSNPAFAFTGVQPGDPLWIAVQGTPGVGEAWPGIRNDQVAGTFGSYIPTDLRVSQVTARPWIRLTLVDYQPPHGKTSHFSMWNTVTGQPPTVWMSTFNTSVENSYHYAAGSHNHAAFGFSATGIHRVTLQASAFLGPGATNPTGLSAPFTLIFAVGTVGRWQAESFNLAQLADSNISSLTADPDSDNTPNLLEYAFGTHPLHPSQTPMSAGLGIPVFSLTDQNGTLYQTLTYPRRRAASRLLPDIYQPWFATEPNGTWTQTNVTTQSTDFPPPMDALNTQWELVTSRRPVPPGDTKGFGRILVTAGDGN